MRSNNFDYYPDPNHQSNEYLYPVQKRTIARGRADTNGSMVSGDSRASSSASRYNNRQPRKSLTGAGGVVDEQAKGGQSKVQILKKVQLEGVSRYNQAQSIVGKIFWMLLAILFMVMLVRGLYKNVYDYLMCPVATTFTINTPSELEFPDVYLCMGNAFSRSYLVQHPEALSDSSVFDSLVSNKRRKRDVDSSMEAADLDDADEFREFFESIDPESVHGRYPRAASNDSDGGKKLELYDIVIRGGFQIKNTFLKCSFHGQEEVEFNCSDIVRTVIDPNYYLCYVVTVPPPYKQVRARKGLSLIINSQVSDYPTGVNDTKPNAVAGLYVSVSDRFDPTNWYKTLVRPGHYTKLDLAGTHVQLINLTRGALIQPCMEDGRELYKLFNTSYSRTACQMDCLLYEYYETCECILMMDRSILNQTISARAPFCSPKQAQGCVKTKIINSAEKQKKVSECAKYCYTPCDSIRYEMRASRARLTEAIRDGLDLNATRQPTSDLVRLDVSFRRMEMAELVQAWSKTPAILVSDIGGTMNFWLGASLIALIELITMLTGTFCYLICRRYEKKKAIAVY